MRKVPSWDEYFMKIAEAVASRSKDSSTQVGSVIIDSNRRIVSTGYNGFPPGFGDTPTRWEKPAKYSFVVHSEAAAITYGGKDLRDCTLYVTLHPCNECAKLIVASGIKKVVYRDYREEYSISRDILQQCNVTLVQLQVNDGQV